MIQNEAETIYTDAPALHPNLVLGGLHVLFWLFFRPSAWRNLVARLAPGLRPGFCLAELNWMQWRNPALGRVVVQGYLIVQVMIAALIWLLLVLLDIPGDDLRFRLAFGVAFGVAFGLALGVAVGVAFGIALGAAVALAFGVVLGVAGSRAMGVAIGLAFGAVLGVAGSVVCGVTGDATRIRTVFSLAWQVGSIVAGVVIGVGVFVLVFGGMLSGLGLGLDAVQTTGLMPNANDQAAGALGYVLVSVVFGVAAGVMIGAAAGLRTQSWRRGLAFSLLFGVVFSLAMGIVFGLASGAAFGMAAGLVFGALTGAFFALPYVLAGRIGGAWAGAVAGTLGSGGGWLALLFALGGKTLIWPTSRLDLVCILLGLTLAWWRPALMYPLELAWGLALLRADERRAPGRPSLLRWQAAFWDEHQRLRLYGLEEHLALVITRDGVAQHDLAEGQAALRRLSKGHQRWAAQAAQIELDARRLESCADMGAIAGTHRAVSAGELPGPASALLRSFSRVSQDAEAALRQESAYNRRLALSAVEDRLDGLVRELTRSSEPYAVRFQAIAEVWRQHVAAGGRQLAQEAEERQEIDSPYIIGVPLTEQQEIFVGRGDVSARIEQLLLDRRRPPLLLYGQRRMGKTSLLNNIGRLLPSTIVPLFVDLQGPVTQASDHAGLLYNLGRGMAESAQRQRGVELPPLQRKTLAGDAFTAFDEWLDGVEARLGTQTGLLALDEFEALESAIGRGRFEEEAILGMLRHVIQHRAGLKVLLAGSHTLEELVRWSSYLINVQVVHIGYLKVEEARQLIERPVEGFALKYTPDASQRVLELTRGHPFLVQLLCAEIVALKNEQPPAIRRQARVEDVEEAVGAVMSHGSFFFADIERNQVDAAGLEVLRAMAHCGEAAAVEHRHIAPALAGIEPPALAQALQQLARRELIEPAGPDAYRFQVELIRRWFVRFDLL